MQEGLEKLPATQKKLQGVAKHDGGERLVSCEGAWLEYHAPTLVRHWHWPLPRLPAGRKLSGAPSPQAHASLKSRGYILAYIHGATSEV